MQKTSILVENLTVKFRTNKEITKAVDNLSLEIKAGECLAIIGVNASGKSTLCHAINNLVVSHSGSIKIFGKPHHTVSRNLLGYMIPQWDFYHDMTGRDVLHFSLGSRGFTREDSIQRASYWLKKVGLIKYPDQKFSGYSLGMLGRLKCAATLAHEPEIVILDEPFTGLDFVMQHTLSEIIEEQKSLGRTIILISHNYAKIAKHADKVMIMHKGQALQYADLSHYYSISEDLNESFFRIYKDQGFDVETSDYC